ncbi:uncharacterized protein BO87DRAFT_378948 [Aspergillus neoniger CBS 115656]|uniref:Uncharacterized protein n=1 Tax=Aspergillus neoniger (strain CBS 115656) TaxID=1448310 RepID=A0A318YCE6_ASPNB|nr:hypothetical protein BO87DRAFT_378948 [Aspergillus neoniger CBS 115656]PYH31654.1 hypothetical protein BO87DRAFT_378948 [Aspergillus neoniger CBS 115656]
MDTSWKPREHLSVVLLLGAQLALVSPKFGFFVSSDLSYFNFFPSFSFPTIPN